MRSFFLVIASLTLASPLYSQNNPQVLDNRFHGAAVKPVLFLPVTLQDQAVQKDWTLEARALADQRISQWMRERQISESLRIDALEKARSFYELAALRQVLSSPESPLRGKVYIMSSAERKYLENRWGEETLSANFLETLDERVQAHWVQDEEAKRWPVFQLEKPEESLKSIQENVRTLRAAGANASGDAYQRFAAFEWAEMYLSDEKNLGILSEAAKELANARKAVPPLDRTTRSFLSAHMRLSEAQDALKDLNYGFMLELLDFVEKKDRQNQLGMDIPAVRQKLEEEFVSQTPYAALVKELYVGSGDNRMKVIQSLAEEGVKDPRAADAMASYILNDPLKSLPVVEIVTAELGGIGPNAVRGLIRILLESPQINLRWHAIGPLVKHGYKNIEAIKALQKSAMNEDNLGLRRKAAIDLVDSVGHRGMPYAIEAFIKGNLDVQDNFLNAWHSGNWKAKYNLTKADETLVKALQEHLTGRSPLRKAYGDEVSRKAGEILVKIGLWNPALEGQVIKAFESTQRNSGDIVSVKYANWALNDVFGQKERFLRNYGKDLAFRKPSVPLGED